MLSGFDYIFLLDSLEKVWDHLGGRPNCNAFFCNEGWKEGGFLSNVSSLFISPLFILQIFIEASLCEYDKKL